MPKKLATSRPKKWRWSRSLNRPARWRKTPTRNQAWSPMQLNGRRRYPQKRWWYHIPRSPCLTALKSRCQVWAFRKKHRKRRRYLRHRRRRCRQKKCRKCRQFKWKKYPHNRRRSNLPYKQPTTTNKKSPRRVLRKQPVTNPLQENNLRTRRKSRNLEWEDSVLKLRSSSRTYNIDTHRPKLGLISMMGLPLRAMMVRGISQPTLRLKCGRKYYGILDSLNNLMENMRS